MKMKLISKILILSLCTLLFNCSSNYEEVSTTIEMQKINGDWTTSTYMLPKDCNYYISTNRGSYILECSKKGRKWYNKEEHWALRAGIVDYRIIK